MSGWTNYLASMIGLPEAAAANGVKLKMDERTKKVNDAVDEIEMLLDGNGRKTKSKSKGWNEEIGKKIIGVLEKKGLLTEI